jgi:hypothetical protein
MSYTVGKKQIRYYEIDGYYFIATRKETAKTAYWLLKGRSCNKIKELESAVHLDKSIFRDAAAIITLYSQKEDRRAALINSTVSGQVKPAPADDLQLALGQDGYSE